MIYRYFVENALSHVYNRGNQKRDRFLEESDYNYFISLLRRYSKKYDIKIIAYCLLPNHYHLIIQQSSPKSLSKFMHSVGTAYAMYFNKKYKTVGRIFQSPYRANLIKDERSLENEIRYILNNPVKHGIVDDPSLYKWVGMWDKARPYQL